MYMFSKGNTLLMALVKINRDWSKSMFYLLSRVKMLSNCEIVGGIQSTSIVRYHINSLRLFKGVFCSRL